MKQGHGQNETKSVQSCFLKRVQCRSKMVNTPIQLGSYIYKVVKYRKILLIYNVYFIFSLVKI